MAHNPEYSARISILKKVKKKKNAAEIQSDRISTDPDILGETCFTPWSKMFLRRFL